MFDRQLSSATRLLLRCPICRASLEAHDAQLRCTNAACARAFPVVDGIPVLLNEARSIFAIDDFLQRRDTTAKLERRGADKLLNGVLNRLPAINDSNQSQESY